MTLPSGRLMALGAIALVAAVYLPFPLKGDQSMFLYAARELADGARLYIDFWDMKQPGIYWFYQAAGSLFGFNPVGFRILELLWMLMLAAGLMNWMAPELRNRWLTPWIALYAVGLAYGTTYWNSVYGGQVEFLVALPIAATLFSLRPKTYGAIQWNALAGASAAIVATFKLVLLIIPAALIALAVLRAVLIDKQSWRNVIAKRVAPAIAGFAACSVVVGIAFWWQGSMSQAWWANFIYPPLAIEEFSAAPLWRMRASIETFLTEVWPILPLALIGVVDGLRRRSYCVIALLTWIAAATIAVLIQVLSWWIYHFALFVVPFGLLAILGADACVGWLVKLRMPATLAHGSALAICSVPLLLAVLMPALHQVNRVWLRGAPPWIDLPAFEDRADATVASVRRGAAFLLSADAHQGPIGILGDPRVVRVSGRRPVPEINGWTYALPHQLVKQAEDLKRTRPPYVYVSSYLAHLHTNGTTALYQALSDLYRLQATDEARGAWYVRKDLASN